MHATIVFTPFPMKNYPIITKIAPSKSSSHLKFISKTRQFTVRLLTVSLFLINGLIAQIKNTVKLLTVYRFKIF